MIQRLLQLLYRQLFPGGVKGDEVVCGCCFLREVFSHSPRLGIFREAQSCNFLHDVITPDCCFSYSQTKCCCTIPVPVFVDGAWTCQCNTAKIMFCLYLSHLGIDLQVSTLGHLTRCLSIHQFHQFIRRLSVKLQLGVCSRPVEFGQSPLTSRARPALGDLSAINTSEETEGNETHRTLCSDFYVSEKRSLKWFVLVLQPAERTQQSQVGG